MTTLVADPPVGPPAGPPAAPPVGLDHDAVVALEDKAHALAGVTEQKAVDLAATVDAKAAALATATAEAASRLASESATAATRALGVEVERAAFLARDRADAATALAVKAALREQHVDQVLEAHSTRLGQINGSQDRMEATQGAHTLTLARIEAVATKRLARRTFLVTTAGVLITMASATFGALGATGNL